MAFRRPFYGLSMGVLRDSYWALYSDTQAIEIESAREVRVGNPSRRLELFCIFVNLSTEIVRLVTRAKLVFELLTASPS